MFKHYLKIALRTIWQQKVYSAITITGLAIAICACTLIALYVESEYDHDRFHTKGQRIFRVTNSQTLGVTKENTSLTQFPVGPNLLREFPQIEKAVRFYPWLKPVLSAGDQKIAPETVFFADAAAVDVFDFPFITGRSEHAFSKQNTIVLTERLAILLFGHRDVIGQTVQFENKHLLEVTGVIADVSQQSHMKLDALINFSMLDNQIWPTWDGFENNWVWTSSWTYLLLKSGEAASELEALLPQFVQRHFPETTKNATKLTLQPLPKIHLHSQLGEEMKPNGNMLQLYIFGSIAALILLLACINFINLTTARAGRRAREVGIRKVVGGFRRQITRQFMGETFLFSSAALVFGLVLVDLCLPFFNNMTGKQLSISYISQPLLPIVAVGILLFVSVLAGFYPAHLLSAFNPTRALKGAELVSGGRSASLRRILVISQFAVTIALLVAVGVIYRQLHFLHNKNMGYAKEQIVLIETPVGQGKDFTGLKNSLSSYSEISTVAEAFGAFPGDGVFTYRFVPEGGSKESPSALPLMWADENFLQMMGVELLAGRLFSKAFPNDREEAFIINESAAKTLGWQENAVGKNLMQFEFGGTFKHGKVVGVVRDFHFESLHKEVKPLVITSGGGNVIVKIRGERYADAISRIEAAWRIHLPERPLQFTFLDQRVQAQYDRELRLGQVIRSFSGLAVLIASLGLLGLAGYAAEQKRKEIGIRKVLGASVVTIIRLLYSEFAVLLSIAFVVAAPLGYFIMNWWLSDFAYRVTIEYYEFIFAALVTLTLSFGVVGYNTLKAALANPVVSLKHE